MLEHAYDIVPFQADLIVPVVKLLSMLWGDDEDSNRCLFEWKYIDNMNTDDPLGVVALSRGEVVGFRGYFGLRFQGPQRGEPLVVLLPGDTCVRPDWRRRGLSIAMGKRAAQDYVSRYRFFLNMTCSRKSLPGYRKLGFLPLAPKTYLTRCPWLNLLQYLPMANAESTLSARRNRCGNRGRVLVTDSPDPVAMAVVADASGAEDHRIRLLQDEGFFRWRYRNRGQTTLFYYLVTDGDIVGYVVMRLAPNGQRGYILDYAESEKSSIREILRFMIESKHFLVLSIYDFSPDEELKATLRDLGFKSRGVLNSIEKRRWGELPLLLRPIREPRAEEDFFFAGLDTRDIANWSLKPICSDGV